MNEYLTIMDQINQRFEQFKLLVFQETKEIEALESFHLTPQQEIIMSYIIRNAPIIAKDIANYLNISKSAISQVIPKLEEKNLIYREINPANRRETFIHLGTRGHEYRQLLEKIDTILVEKYYSKVSIEELKAILDALNTIVEEK